MPTLTAPKPPPPRARFALDSSSLTTAATSTATRPVVVHVEYSEPSNFRSVAEALAGAIRRECASEAIKAHVELVPSRAGVFEITVNGRVVYSKRATLRLPTHDEIFYHVNAAASAALPD